MKDGQIRIPGEIHKKMKEYLAQRRDAGEYPKPTMASLIDEMWAIYQKKAYLTPLKTKLKNRIKRANTSLAEVIETGISDIEIMLDREDDV